MINMRKLMIIILISLILSVGACGTLRPVQLSKNFVDNEDASIQLPKYECAAMNICWTLNLHPKDIVLNLDLSIDDFGYKKGLQYSYNKNTKKLCFTIGLDEAYTITDKATDIDIKVAYLAHYTLRTKNRDYEIYNPVYIKRRIKYSTRYKKSQSYAEPIFDYNRWNLQDWRFSALYKELRPITNPKKKKLLSKLGDDFIGRIRSTDLRNYVKTAKGLLNMMLTQAIY